MTGKWVNLLVTKNFNQIRVTLSISHSRLGFGKKIMGHNEILVAVFYVLILDVHLYKINVTESVLRVRFTNEGTTRYFAQLTEPASLVNWMRI